jgi:hypothetical protein
LAGLLVLKNDYSVVEELKKTIFELKVENNFLKTKLRSLALCSRCSQPLPQSNPAQNGDDPSDRRSNTPESDPTSSDPEDPNDEEFDELTLRCRQMSLGPMTPYLGPASSLALAGNVIVVGTPDITFFHLSLCLYRCMKGIWADPYQHQVLGAPYFGVYCR